jgi:hypothetical protein
MRREIKFRDKTVFYDIPNSFEKDEKLNELDKLIVLVYEHESQLYGRLANIAEAYLSSTDSRLKPLKTILNSILSAQIDDLLKRIVEITLQEKKDAKI